MIRGGSRGSLPSLTSRRVRVRRGRLRTWWLTARPSTQSASPSTRALSSRRMLRRRAPVWEGRGWGESFARRAAARVATRAAVAAGDRGCLSVGGVGGPGLCAHRGGTDARRAAPRAGGGAVEHQQQQQRELACRRGRRPVSRTHRDGGARERLRSVRSERGREGLSPCGARTQLRLSFAALGSGRVGAPGRGMPGLSPVVVQEPQFAPPAAGRRRAGGRPPAGAPAEHPIDVVWLTGWVYSSK